MRRGLDVEIRDGRAVEVLDDGGAVDQALGRHQPSVHEHAVFRGEQQVAVRDVVGEGAAADANRGGGFRARMAGEVDAQAADPGDGGRRERVAREGEDFVAFSEVFDGAFPGRGEEVGAGGVADGFDDETASTIGGRLQRGAARYREVAEGVGHCAACSGAGYRKRRAIQHRRSDRSEIPEVDFVSSRKARHRAAVCEAKRQAAQNELFTSRQGPCNPVKGKTGCDPRKTGCRNRAAGADQFDHAGAIAVGEHREAVAVGDLHNRATADRQLTNRQVRDVVESYLSGQIGVDKNIVPTGWQRIRAPIGRARPEEGIG